MLLTEEVLSGFLVWETVRMTDRPNITIRPLSDLDSIEELTQLLHRAYKILADMQLRFVATYQDVETTRKRISGGICFVAECDGKIVGTITYYSPAHTGGSPFLDLPETAHMGQLGVEPEVRGRRIGKRLIEQVESVAIADGATELALDTAEPARHLIEWYERMGYRFIEHVQ
jgi:ribosomal protein S18 acetylase RimI-like enzyme